MSRAKLVRCTRDVLTCDVRARYVWRHVTLYWPLLKQPDRDIAKSLAYKKPISLSVQSRGLTSPKILQKELVLLLQLLLKLSAFSYFPFFHLSQAGNLRVRLLRCDDFPLASSFIFLLDFTLLYRLANDPNTFPHNSSCCEHSEQSLTKAKSPDKQLKNEDTLSVEFLNGLYLSKF